MVPLKKIRQNSQNAQNFSGSVVRFLIPFILLILSLILRADNPTVIFQTGIISGRPLTNAAVEIERIASNVQSNRIFVPMLITNVTDSSGNFTLTNLEPFDYRITIDTGDRLVKWTNCFSGVTGTVYASDYICGARATNGSAWSTAQSEARYLRSTNGTGASNLLYALRLAVAGETNAVGWVWTATGTNGAGHWAQATGGGGSGTGDMLASVDGLNFTNLLALKASTTELVTASNAIFLLLTNYDAISSNGLYTLLTNQIALTSNGLWSSASGLITATTNGLWLQITNWSTITSNGLAAMIALKANSASPTFTGTATFGAVVVNNNLGAATITLPGGDVQSMINSNLSNLNVLSNRVVRAETTNATQTATLNTLGTDTTNNFALKLNITDFQARTNADATRFATDEASIAGKQSGSMLLSNFLAMGISNIVMTTGSTAGLGTNAGLLWITNVISTGGGTFSYTNIYGGIYTTVFGEDAAVGATNVEEGTFIGYHAGRFSTNAGQSVLIGDLAGQNLTGDSANASQAVTAIGWRAATSAHNMSSMVALGYQAADSADGGQSAVVIGTHVAQGAANFAYSVLLGYYIGSSSANWNNCIIIGGKGEALDGAYSLWIDGYRGINLEPSVPLISGNFLSRYLRLRGNQIIDNTLESSNQTALTILGNTASSDLFAVTNRGARKFVVSSEGVASAAGGFTGSGAGLTNVPVSDIVSNIVVRDTNAIVLDFSAANEFTLTLLTNFNITYTHVSSLARQGYIHFLQDTQGGWLAQSILVSGGLLRTNANQQCTTNANAYDLLEVKRDIFQTNLLTWWPQNFQPRVASAQHFGGNTFINGGVSDGLQDFGANYGFKFTVGASDLSVSDLGMYADASDTASSITVVIKDSACSVTVATASCNTSSHDGGFHYTAITPVTLAAGSTYTIMATTFSVFNHKTTDWTAASGATVIDDTYNGCNNSLWGAGKISRGPNFKYE